VGAACAGMRPPGAGGGWRLAGWLLHRPGSRQQPLLHSCAHLCPPARCPLCLCPPQFPSHHFYGGRLRDADAIRDTPPALFYEHPLMKPYVFFDVAKGQERRREGGGSLSNRVGGAGRRLGKRWVASRTLGRRRWCSSAPLVSFPPFTARCSAAGAADVAG
jgi:hypothetical protein